MPLSLPSDHAFLWHQKLKEQVAVRNITDLHLQIALRLYALLEAGEEHITHHLLAAGRGISAVQDALRRLRALGFITWEPQYVVREGRNRRTANRYRIIMPVETTRPRPELRRRAGAVHRALSKQKEIAQERAWISPAEVVRASEARIIAAWQRARAARTGYWHRPSLSA